MENDDNIIKPLSWWRGLRGTCELADVAARMLGAPVTSAATERTFSTFSGMHSKKRNRLSKERAAKLTLLSYNWKLMNAPPPKKKKKERKDEAEGTYEETGEQEEGEEMPEFEDDDEIESSIEDHFLDLNMEMMLRRMKKM
jgi:hypothetical protein